MRNIMLYSVLCTQSHYREVPRWEIVMEQELRFGMDLGRLVFTKKKKNIWADNEQLLRLVFSSFRGQKIKLLFFTPENMKKLPSKVAHD